MARRARMLALLHLSSLVFLLVVELTHTAPVSDGSSINITGDGRDRVFLEKSDVVAHTLAPTEAVGSEDTATTIQGGNSVSEEEVNVHEDSLVTKVSSVESAEENVDKDEDFRSTKSEKMAGAPEESEEVSEENMDKHKDSLSIKNEEGGSAAVSDANVDKPEVSLVTNNKEDGNMTEGSDADVEENVEKHEDHTSTETEEDTSASGANDAVLEESVVKHEDFMVTKTEEHTGDTETKQNVDKVDSSITDTAREDVGTPDDRENVLKENTDKHEAKATDYSANEEQIGTAITGDDNSDNLNESVDTSEDKIVEEDAVESTSPGKDSEENIEIEAAGETALNKDTSEGEISEEDVSEDNEETEDKHDTASRNSSEETSVALNEAEDIEVKENENKVLQESLVTSSPFAQLRLPSSDSQHVEKDEPHNTKDTAMEGHEGQNPSIEETAENEAGSPDELIENDSVDSEVIKSDNKTAALGKAMEITGAEENVQNKDESEKTEGLEGTKQGSETPVVLKESENTEVKNSIEHQDTKSGEKKVESTLAKAPETVHETDDDDDYDYDDDEEEEENENDNLLDKEDRHPKGHFEHRNEDKELDVGEETFKMLHVTENPSEEEGSGVAAGRIEFPLHGDNGHNDTAETSSQEKHEAGSIVRKDNDKEKTSEETGHHTGVFEDFGSGHEEEEREHIAKQENNETDNVEDDTGSGSHALHEHYEDILSEEHNAESNVFSSVPHVPIVDDYEENSAEDYSESPTPENETSSKMSIFEHADNQNESGNHHLKEENLAENKTNVQVMSVNPVPDDSDDYHVGFDGSGDDYTTTPVPVLTDTSDELLANIMKDIIDDSMTVSSKEIDSVNTSVIGKANPAYREKPVEKVILPQLESAAHAPTTKPPCIEDADNEDCLFQSNKPYEDAEANILEDDDEVPPEPTKADVHSKSTSSDNLKELEVVISTTPAVKVSSEEESSHRPIAVDFNEPRLHFGEEVISTAITAEMQEITEPTDDFEAMDNETAISNGAPDTIVEHPLSETGVKEMSGKLKVANVNELGVSGQENSEDVGESEALDSSTASGSYVVLGCIMAVVVVLLAYAAIKSRRERATNTSSKKQSEIAGDDDDGTELKDMKKALLPPETPHDDCNGDIEANRKPLMDKDENQEEEEKEPIIKQNGTLELSEPPGDKESQVKSSPAENQLKTMPTPTSNKPQQRNGLSEVVVEKPAISNGKADSVVTHPVSAKVKVIENEDSIAKTPVIINRGSNSPSH